MQNVQLINQSIDEFTFQKNMKPDQSVKLETQIKYSVHFFADQKLVQGNAFITIQDSDHEGLFRLKYHHIAAFSIDDFAKNDEEKRILHLSTARILHPLWCQTIKQFCVLLGIPPIELPNYNISEDNIQMS